MTGKVVAITSATSGIGQMAAEKLAAMGARIVQVARNPARGLLSNASEISGAEGRIDVLVNNAGAIFPRRQLTEEGLERTFALNHMAYFVLTLGLLARLEWAACAAFAR